MADPTPATLLLLIFIYITRASETFVICETR